MDALNKVFACTGKPRFFKWLRRLIVPGLFGISLLSFVGLSTAQDLINTGTIDNTGTFRLKNQAIGLPGTVGGVFEYFGGNQVIPSTRYAFLQLTGSGTKTTSGGDFSVAGDILIGGAVISAVETGAVIDLEGTLTELGYLTGSIKKTVALNGGTTSSNFGNIGGTVSWTNTAPGVTTIQRTSGTPVSGNGHQSIDRFYDITATTNGGLTSTFEFRYENRELNGQDSTKLLLWRSIDGGTTWINERGTLDVAGRKITKTGIMSLGGRWTAADSAHALGPFRNAAANLLYAAGNNQSNMVRSTLAAFVVRVTDSAGFPVESTSVSFVIASVPAGATGQSLSGTNTTTDANGEASTLLTLGDKIGIYTVTASSGSLAGSPVTFTATGTAAAAKTIALTSGDNQSSVVRSALTNPFVVTVSDTFGNPVQGTIVTFSIDSVPSGATGQAMSDTNATTGANGQASTLVTLGDKIGPYTIRATSAGLSGNPVSFAATGIAAAAKTINLSSGSAQSDSINRTLVNPFVVVVSDTFGNPVQGTNVTFAIDSIPTGATGQSLSVTNATTDTMGRAATFLTLGNLPGRYTVTAASIGLTGSPITFAATALSLTGIEAFPFKPTEFQLFQNYPNPFNPVTEIQFDVKERGHVKLMISDILGQVVDVLVDEQKEGPVRYKAQWNAMNHASGVYFMRLVIEPDNRSTSTYVSVKRMLLAK